MKNCTTKKNSNYLVWFGLVWFYKTEMINLVTTNFGRLILSLKTTKDNVLVV